MDFYFNEESEFGINIIRENNYFIIKIPINIYNSLDYNRINNWIIELKGEKINCDNIFKVYNIKPSEIYNTYYHFIE